MTGGVKRPSFLRIADVVRTPRFSQGKISSEENTITTKKGRERGREGERERERDNIQIR